MFCTNIGLSKKINEEFNAVAVEMEGASIGMTSYLSGIPFLVIRSISDVIGKDNLITYDKFLKKSSTEVAEFTLEIINNL
jgi:MTA/SAH nucleosidase